jgi:hypothetical protein
MFRRLLILAMALTIVGCGKTTTDDSAGQAQAVIEGVLSEASYKKAATKALAETQAIMADPALTEDQLNAKIAKIETLLGLADQLSVDKSKLDEAELMSTLGALYARKAAFHVNSAQQAGALVSKGFRYLDKAISKYPDNITARINRGITSAKVPEFMNKTEVAREDLEFVLNSLDFSGLTPGLQADVKAMLAEVNQRSAPSAD